MRAILVACALAGLLPVKTGAQQDQPPDFSGRWVLSAIAHSAGPDTLDAVAADTLLVTQTPSSSLSSTHRSPKRIPGRAPGILAVESESRWSVSFVGSQLIISESTTVRKGDAATVNEVTAGLWRLGSEGRLVIEFGERRTGQDPKSATLVYVRPS